MEQRPSRHLVPLFAGTLFLSAFLLFAVQPMFVRAALPLLGGASAVWNTAMVFFQTALLAGYVYVHLSSRRLTLKRQAVVHGVVLALGLLFLPLGVAKGWTPPLEAQSVWLLGLLGVSVGVPFFALSASSPLLLRWFSHSKHATAADPYFLSVASNVGSLGALIAYPLFIDRFLPLSVQSRAWTVGYVVLACGIAACAFALRSVANETETPKQAQPLLPGTRVRWLVLSATPAALLVGVTLHISTEIAAAPLLWVLPLALYLLSFVVAFAKPQLGRTRWMPWLHAFGCTVLVVLFEWRDLGVLLGLHLSVFFLCALVCHLELALLRPEPARLTEFYLLQSAGGVVGGMCAALIAPVVFSGVYEYPLALLIAMALRPAPVEATPQPSRSEKKKQKKQAPAPAPVRPWLPTALDFVIPLALGVTLYFQWPTKLALAALGAEQVKTSVSVFLIAFMLWVSRRSLRFALTCGVCLVALAVGVFGAPDYRLHRVRTFFGVYTVNDVEEMFGTSHLLVSGTTYHGVENQLMRRVPTAYYVREGPVGQVIELAALQGEVKHLGAIGLGVGAVACYGGPDRKVTFFELDPEVEHLARDERFFHFLSDCPNNEVVLGDGRLGLARVPDGSFEVLILDAFAGDAVPTHLLTREAMQLYLQKLTPHGKLLIHATNAYVDLLPTIGDLASDAHLAAWVSDYDDWEASPLAWPCTWVALSRVDTELEPLQAFTTTGWRRLERRDRAPWTDDHTDLIDALRWKASQPMDAVKPR